MPIRCRVHWQIKIRNKGHSSSQVDRKSKNKKKKADPFPETIWGSY
jgi:hypothetical protein